eukprot:6295224-Prymnesium_polylepis.1
MAVIVHTRADASVRVLQVCKAARGSVAVSVRSAASLWVGARELFVPRASTERVGTGGQAGSPGQRIELVHLVRQHRIETLPVVTEPVAAAVGCRQVVPGLPCNLVLSGAPLHTGPISAKLLRTRVPKLHVTKPCQHRVDVKILVVVAEINDPQRLIKKREGQTEQLLMHQWKGRYNRSTAFRLCCVRATSRIWKDERQMREIPPGRHRATASSKGGPAWVIKEVARHAAFHSKKDVIVGNSRERSQGQHPGRSRRFRLLVRAVAQAQTRRAAPNVHANLLDSCFFIVRDFSIWAAQEPGAISCKRLQDPLIGPNTYHLAVHKPMPLLVVRQHLPAATQRSALSHRCTRRQTKDVGGVPVAHVLRVHLTCLFSRDQVRSHQVRSQQCVDALQIFICCSVSRRVQNGKDVHIAKRWQQKLSQ